ncbi:PREDICTED: uncharacterized protein C20orf96 homolog, partial [Mesitornis unicolor]|uniref:uncharacterized protein C20orf96 homolog n=1 Tax=Mesitornis unicolor TaxID=54374 RepID=UPI00052819BC
AFTPNKNPPLPSATSSPQGEHRGSTRRKSELRKGGLAKTLEEVKITMRNATEELKERGACLVQTDCRLLEDIRHTEESTAKQARLLLQRHGDSQKLREKVQTLNQSQLETARAELQEMEKTMEKNLGKLQAQLDEVTAKTQVLQDELHVPWTHIDGENLKRAADVVHLQRSIQSLKKQQQEEITKTEEMGKAVLKELEEKAGAEREELIQKVAEEMSRHQDGLKQMVLNNRFVRQQIPRGREVIKDLEKEIEELKRSIQMFHQCAKDPREMIFPDVLLRRPKCTPDTEVVLNLPTNKMPLV